MWIGIGMKLQAYANIPRFIKLVWRTQPWLVAANLILRLFQALIPLLILSIGKQIIDQVVAISTKQVTNHEDVWKLVIVEFALVVLIAVLSRVVILLDDLLGELLTNRTNMALMAHAAVLDLAQFENAVFYDKLARAREQTVGRSQLVSQLFGQAQDLLTIISCIMVLLAFNSWLILVLLLSIIPLFAGSFYFNRRNYQLVRSQTHGKRHLEYLMKLGTGDETSKELRLFRLSSFLINKYKNIAAEFYRSKKKLGITQAIVSSLLIIPVTMGFYFSFVYIIRQVMAGALTLGGLTFLLGIIRQLGSLVQSSGRRFKSVAEGAIYLQDYFDFFKIMPQQTVAVNPRPFPLQMKTGFQFENVGYRYAGSDRWASRGLSFVIRPGEKLALVGENGAGKTTIIKLLVRLYEPSEGRILLEGHDLYEYDIDELRKAVGLIFQDYVRYQMTAGENIAIGDIDKREDEASIVDAAKQSLAHDIIDRFPDKYNQVLGHYFADGVELSGGEWQKVALARAYIRNAPVIILDEPTAALDARAEYEIFQRFAELADNKTAIFISHRFSTVRMADRILVLEKGKIIETGSHEELVSQGGRYAQLFQLQASGYR
jgi:ATP-binding cassette subfamily B protein